MTSDQSVPPYPSVTGMRELNGRRVFWTGRVAIGLRFEAATPPSPDTLPVTLALLAYELKETLHV